MKKTFFLTMAIFALAMMGSPAAQACSGHEGKVKHQGAANMSQTGQPDSQLARLTTEKNSTQDSTAGVSDTTSGNQVTSSTESHSETHESYSESGSKDQGATDQAAPDTDQSTDEGALGNTDESQD